MSEFTNNYEKRINLLSEYLLGLLDGENGLELLEKYQIKTENFVPTDILGAFDILIQREIPFDKLKIVSNKLFNILFETLNNYPTLHPKQDSFLHYVVADNLVVRSKMQNLKPLIKEINISADNNKLEALKKGFEELSDFAKHYIVIENIIFPFVEKKWKHHLCVKLMWSFHDDIRHNIQKMIVLLENQKFDLKEFNELAGIIFFNISTIILREEKVIIPTLLETAGENEIDEMLQEAKRLGFAYIDIPIDSSAYKALTSFVNSEIQTPTGKLKIEQFVQIFNYLPVDITFVDENDEVRFFSNPPHRIFPRTSAIIGRKVQFCHPPESVHIVNQILDDFRSGREDSAPFWINMHGKMIFIEYFAMRNEKDEYLGTLEVSHDVTRYRELEGEQRILSYQK